MKTVKRVLIAGVVLLAFGGTVACRRKLQCATNDMNLPEGVSIVMMGKTYTGGPGGCCAKIEGGAIVTDCATGGP